MNLFERLPTKIRGFQQLARSTGNQLVDGFYAFSFQAICRPDGELKSINISLDLFRPLPFAPEQNDPLRVLCIWFRVRRKKLSNLILHHSDALMRQRLCLRSKQPPIYRLKCPYVVHDVVSVVGGYSRRAARQMS